MFRNKHVLAALIITPILSILAYFAVDKMVSEKPKAAVAGGSYELIALPNCRYASGICGLKNGDFKVILRVTYLVDGGLLLSLESAFPLQGGRIALVENINEVGEPAALRTKDKEKLNWSVTLPKPQSEDSLIQLAIAANDSLYYAQTGLVFSHYQTKFGEDFRAE